MRCWAHRSAPRFRVIARGAPLDVYSDFREQLRRRVRSVGGDCDRRAVRPRRQPSVCCDSGHDGEPRHFAPEPCAAIARQHVTGERERASASAR
jgi:hypothetical protein